MKKTLILALAALLVVGGATAKPSSRTRSKAKSSAKSSTKSVTVRAIYTMVGCSHCTVLESAVRRAGVRLSKSHTSEYRFASYPTVVYSDGRSDNGQRLSRRAARLPKSLRVVEAY